MNKTRLEAFTDAVIAIAATIMVLELKPPASISLAALAADWPILVAYIFSFANIYVVWYEHHNLFNKAKVISARTFLLNGLWLFMLTLVPFTTAWVGEHVNATLPEVSYLLVMFLWSLAFQLMDISVLRDNPGIERDVSTRKWVRWVLYGGCLVGMLIAFVWPIGALIMVGLIGGGLGAGLMIITPPTPRVH